MNAKQDGRRMNGWGRRRVTEKIRSQMRQLYADGRYSQRQLGQMFGLDHKTVGKQLVCRDYATGEPVCYQCGADLGSAEPRPRFCSRLCARRFHRAAGTWLTGGRRLVSP